MKMQKHSKRKPATRAKSKAKKQSVSKKKPSTSRKSRR